MSASMAALQVGLALRLQNLCWGVQGLPALAAAAQIVLAVVLMLQALNHMAEPLLTGDKNCIRKRGCPEHRAKLSAHYHMLQTRHLLVGDMSTPKGPPERRAALSIYSRSRIHSWLYVSSSRNWNPVWVTVLSAAKTNRNRLYDFSSSKGKSFSALALRVQQHSQVPQLCT